MHGTRGSILVLLLFVGASASFASEAFVPELASVASRDRDGDKLDDDLDAALTSGGEVEVYVNLEVPTTARHLAAFAAEGGRLRHVLRAVGYGWVGTIPRGRLRALAARLGRELHFVSPSVPMIRHLDEATRTGRVRPVWVPGYAGFTAGFTGASDTTIAILDTGIDGSHSDLAGRMVGWHDYTSDAEPTAVDYVGHGTHVAGIALGTGAAFGTKTGTGTLSFTQNGNLTGVSAGSFNPAPIHTPYYFDPTQTTLSGTEQASWLGPTSTSLRAIISVDNGGFAYYATMDGVTPIAAFGIDDANVNGSTRFSPGLDQSPAADITSYAVTTTLDDYPAVGDGFNTMSGVAPGASWYGAKIFPDSGATGSSSDLLVALDAVTAGANAATGATHVKVINLSLAFSTAQPTIRSAVNSAVGAGIVVVISAGNSGPTGTVNDPGLAAKAITVGAANDINELTQYSNIGSAPADSTEDKKPDVLAPGGSQFRSLIMSTDTNNDDAEVKAFPDAVANNYTGMFGTSMSAPFVSGAAALVIQAIETTTAWSYAGSAQPLLVKMLLCASATETNVARENGTGTDPTLGRAAATKDFEEGYGIINPDAAIEAVVRPFVSPLVGIIVESANEQQWERRAFGRNVAVAAGDRVALSLTVPATADLDLYLYAGTPDAAGNPVLLAASSNVGLGVAESISYTATSAGPAYVFVKRVSGDGSFALTGGIIAPGCGDGVLGAGEDCDPGAPIPDSCCTIECRFATNGAACTDGVCRNGTCTTEVARMVDLGGDQADAATRTPSPDLGNSSPLSTDSGCNCSTTGSPRSEPIWLALFVAVLLRRPRSDRRV